MSVAAETLQKGRYRIDSPVIESGSSSVYPAYDTTSDTNVYVKEIVVRLGKVTTLSQQENSRLAFENAARRISEFRHDSILQVTDFYSEVGRQYLVLEDIDGSDLHTLLSGKSQQHSLEHALDWADQLLDAVNYLHNQKPQVLHGAVCPRNVTLSNAGRIKLLGVTIVDESGNDLSTALADVNDGSLNYSPLELIWNGLDAASQKVILSSYDDRSEKILKDPADIRSDIYSVGATIYLMLTGRVPVDPLERSIELLEGNRDPLKSPNSIDARVAPEISEVVMRALEIKRENRYDSAMIMRQVLRTSVVRAKEREAVDAQELNEAAELMRNTQQLKIPVPPAAIEALAQTPTQPTPPTDSEILAQKLKEAEEMRLQAEQKMAEAEQMMREQTAERARLEAQAKAIHTSAELPATAANDDDLLGISLEPVRTAVDAIQQDIGDADDDIHLSIKPAPRARIDLREIAKKSEPSQPEAIESPQLVEEESEAFLIDVDDEPAAPVREYEPVHTFSFEDHRPKRAGLPIPLIAGVAVAILIAAGLGFMFLGGSSPEPAATVPTQQAAVPVQQPEPQPAAPLQQAEQQPEQVNAFTPETTETTETKLETPNAETHNAAKPVQTAKAKPAEKPVKAPAAKKPVTADDLINDN
ncbi:MAG: protein kinase [Pyrinomonadaceae bacterium]